MKTPSIIAAIVACAVATAPLRARADDGDAGAGDRGEVQLVVVVTGAPDVKLPAVRKATLLVTMERALKRDKRLIVVDRDDRLALKAGRVPTDVVAEARALVSSGEELLRRGQAKPALLKLEGATQQLARVLAWTQKQDLARAQFLLGAAQVLNGDAKAGQATFVSLLAWRPEAVADADIEPTVILPVWEKAQAASKKLGGGSVDLDTAPAGALAYADGRLVGFTPTTVEGLTVGTHYVTVRSLGYERQVLPVVISDARPTQLQVILAPSKGGIDLNRAMKAMQPGIGEALAPAAAQEGFASVGELLGVEEVVALVVEPGEGKYHAYVYATDGGARLADQAIEVGERELEDALAEAVAPLYVEVMKAKAKVVVKPKPKRPPPPSHESHRPAFLHKWWFWAGVGGAVVLAVGLPLLLSGDGEDPLSCPSGNSCGQVIFRF